MSRSAVEVVDLYNFELWNRMRPELLSEICADPLVRHYAGKRVELSHTEQVARVAQIGVATHFHSWPESNRWLAHAASPPAHDAYARLGE